MFGGAAGVPTMNHERARLQTFKTWPKQLRKLSPISMVKAGFYFSPTEKHPDRTVCFCCENSLHSWKAEDDPRYEHRAWYGSCAFISGKKTNNVPISDKELLEICASSKGELVIEHEVHDKACCVL